MLIVARVCVLWATSAGPDSGKTLPVFPSIIVFPFTLRGCVWRRGARAVHLVGLCHTHSGHFPIYPAGLHSYAVFFFNELFNGIPLCPPVTAFSLVSRASGRTYQWPFLFPVTVLQTRHSPQGVLCGRGLCGGLSSSPLPPSLLATPVLPGTTDGNCLTGLSTCHRSCSTPATRTQWPGSWMQPPGVTFLFEPSTPAPSTGPDLNTLSGSLQILPASGLLKDAWIWEAWPVAISLCVALREPLYLFHSHFLIYRVGLGKCF